MPSAAPTAGDSFSVRFEADATRLAGIRFDGSAQPIEAIISAVSSRAEGGSPSHCFMNFGNFSNLEKALGSKVVYDSEQR